MIDYYKKFMGCIENTNKGDNVDRAPTNSVDSVVKSTPTNKEKIPKAVIVRDPKC